ncbi:transposase domain-containing protein [Gallaecimonas xiamenensis]|uniref:Mu transposase n=1 Tax=Gallaecimonas xiamenensis 3-C-1 TaxID=745411 RepID=K2JLE6_9GAMM|nr:transposase domain-containing protein [Gallaecimonas xiamenensis]EKE75217.1 Mu transposase [Gallaecimonas xiamenensis 3-C-1]
MTQGREWLSAAELTGLADLPGTERGMRKFLDRLAEAYPEKKRKRAGTKAFEYHYSLLPEHARAALLKRLGLVQLGNQTFAAPKTKAQRYSPEALWANWERAGDKAQAKAAERLELVNAVAMMVQSGTKLMDAYQFVADNFNAALPTLRRYWAMVKDIDPADWAPALLPKNKLVAQNIKDQRRAEVSPEAWDYLKAEYLRLEQPTFSACYLRTCAAAKKLGWQVPSEDSLRRRLDAEVPHEHQVLLRQGEHALMQLYPPQQRSVLDVAAMEWINGDGYQHNVFVKWHNGEVIRPKTWFWQDIRTRKIIGWRTDISENTDMIRLALLDVIDNYGIPSHITIDNTRAAANKWLTGGVPNRYRFKVKADDPLGLIPMLGIKLHWTSVFFGKGHGQAKPIERAFGVGGLEELVDKHPALAGSYTGPNPMAKPDNYGERAATVAEFERALAEGVAMFNARANRKTEACRGVLSFDDAFAESYAAATVRKASTEQRRLLLLSAEAVRVTRHGTITLDAGGKIAQRQNRYHHESLLAMVGQKVVVRFDPDALHSSVHLYTLNGLYLCEAACLEKVAFGSRSEGREHDRKRKQFVRANKDAATAHQAMSAMEAAQLLPEPEMPTTPAPAASELVHLRDGNTLRKATTRIEAAAEVVTDVDTETAFNRGVAQLMAQRNKDRL